MPLLCCCALAAIAPAISANASPGPTPSGSPAPSSSPNPSTNPVVAALQGRVSSLEQQIIALQLQSAPLQYDAVQAQEHAAAAQAQLAQDQLALANSNVELARTTTLLASVQTKLAIDRKSLAALIVTTYKTTSNSTALRALLSSTSLSQTLDIIVRYSQVTDSMISLVRSVSASNDEITALRAEQTAEQQHAQQQVNAVQAEHAQTLADQARYERGASHLTDRALMLTQQLQDVLAQLAAAEGQQVASVGLSGVDAASLGGAVPPFAFGPRVDDFSWGQCTWYVASLRDVTWGGDAWEWIATAAAQGKPEGMTPKPGSIVVFGPGNGSSAVGHVAYVETVASPNSFIVDEANVHGLGVVDKRLVSSLQSVEGFIY
jgi:surface antigen